MSDYEDYQPHSADSFLFVPGVAGQIHDVRPLKRSKVLYFFLLIPCMWAGISWMGGGIPFLTDLAFSTLLVMCLILIATEVVAFSRRFGVGGLVLFGGTLVWYVHDYFSNWFQINFQFNFTGFSPEVVAKAAFSTTLFVFFAAMGLLLPPWRRFTNMSLKIPEPANNGVYMFAIIATALVGLIPLAFFTKESLPITLWKAMTAMRTGHGPEYTTGRTGNLNYSWGGYLAQLQQIGSTGGVLAAFYVLMVPGKGPSKWLATLIWVFSAALGFGGGSRGEFLFAVFPVAVLLFLKYMLIAADRLRKFSPRAILYSGVFMFCTLFVVQIQGNFRNSGLQGVDLFKMQIFKSQGNDMFSEGLLGYKYFGEIFPLAKNNFPGATFIRPMPDVAFRFAIGWIPRVLWHNKPGIDASAQWLNKMMSGGTAANTDTSGQVTGGTMCPGIAGEACNAYGFAGVIEMGLLFGWLCKLTEEMLWVNLRRPLTVMFALGVAGWLFRCFRDLTPQDLYPLLIGMLFIILAIKFIQVFSGGQTAETPVFSGEYA
ncbi:MAG: hypothetical protein ABSB42_12245 [Tepidisphaeraceae bacterium]|jgi:hypothetical protein